MASIDQSYRLDIILVRACDDGSGKTYETHTGWQLVKYKGQAGEGYEPIDFVTGDVQNDGEKKSTGRILVENLNFSLVHGGGPGRSHRSA